MNKEVAELFHSILWVCIKK